MSHDSQQSASATRREDEWVWVNTAPAEKRALYWKIRRICINAGIPAGQQIAHAERIAETKLGAGPKLQDMSATMLWLTIGALE